MVPQAWSLDAALVLLLLAAAAADDVTTDNDVIEELLASALKDAAEHWELDSFRYHLSSCEPSGQTKWSLVPSLLRGKSTEPGIRVDWRSAGVVCDGDTVPSVLADWGPVDVV